jgi:hypothetical protein
MQRLFAIIIVLIQRWKVLFLVGAALVLGEMLKIDLKIVFGVVITAVGIYFWMSPKWERANLDREYPPLDPKFVESVTASFAVENDSTMVTLLDIKFKVPVLWMAESTIDARRCIFHPAPGLYIDWHVYDFGGEADPPAKLQKQILAQGWARGWRFLKCEVRLIESFDGFVVDAIAEARNGVTHRLINVCFKRREYLCEIKGDSPRLFASAASMLDAHINTIASK